MLTNAQLVNSCYERSVAQKKHLLLTGMRGLGKRGLLEELYLKVRASSSPMEHSVFLDFEDNQTRLLKSGDEMWGHVCERTPTGRLNLFVNEGASLEGAERFWWLALASKRCGMVCVTASSRRIRDLLPDGIELSECHLHPESELRGNEACKAMWSEILVRDVMGGLRLANVRTLELIAKWLSDHMGDPVSLRTMQDDFLRIGYSVAAATLNTYLKALQSTYFFERLDCWDAARWKVSPYDYCYFPVWLDMRKSLWGAAPTRESERMALARAYFRLRSFSGQNVVINTVRNGPHGADFATMEKEGMRLWRVACDGDIERVV